MGCGGSVEGQRYSLENSNNALVISEVSRDGGYGSTKNHVATAPAPAMSSSRQRPPRNGGFAVAAARPVERPRQEQTVKDGVLQLQLDDYTKMQVLDETRYSIVYCLRDNRNGRLVAGKRIQKQCAAVIGDNYMNEVRMLKNLSKHPSIVDLLGVCDSEHEFWIVMVLCGGGHLETWLERFPNTAREIARQVFEAVQHLHGMLIVHLDIKPGNVLFDDTRHVRLCDFATAQQLADPYEQVTSNCGTDGFKAPEVSSGKPYNGIKADIFSLGKTLQVAAKYDEVWNSKALFPLGEMGSRSASMRSDLAAVHGELFSDDDRPATAAKAADPLAELKSELAFEPWAHDTKNHSSGSSARKIGSSQMQQRRQQQPGSVVPTSNQSYPVEQMARMAAPPKAQKPSSGLFAAM